MTRPASGPGRTAAERLAEFSQRPASSGSASAAETKEFPWPSLDVDRTVPISTDPGFRVNWRGYDRVQVDSYRSRVESELASTRIAHERVAQAHAHATEQLHAAQADLGRLRRQRTNTPTALSDRLREILDIAAQDADQTRADAKGEVDQIRAGAKHEAGKIRAEAQTAAGEIRVRANTEAETIVRQARDTAAGIVNGARAEHQKMTAEIEQTQAAARQQLGDAQAEATRIRDNYRAELRQLKADADQAREHADAEAARRRSEADHLAREQRDQAEVAAAARITEMAEQLADLARHRDETLATVGQLHEELAKTLASTASPPSESAATADDPA